MPPDAAADTAHRLSQSLQAIVDDGKAQLSVRDIVDGFEAEGDLGTVLFMLTLPVLLPLPPGASMILSLPLLVVTPQLAFGRPRLWLPDWLADRTIQQKAIARLVDRILPPLTYVERVGRPRWAALTGALGARMIGVIATLIALILILPLPFANLFPAAALAVLAMGLIRKDGLLVIGGYLLFLAAIAIIAVGAKGAMLIYQFVVGHL